MRVWIFNHYALTPDQAGGTRHFDLAREMVRAGHDVTIFASSFHHYERRHGRATNRQGWAVEEFDGVRFVWLRTFPYARNDWRRAWSMVDYARKAVSAVKRLHRSSRSILPAPDVVIGSSVHLLAADAARRVARRFDVPFVLEIRDLWPRTLIDMGALRWYHPVALVMAMLERVLYRRAVRIITPLPFAHEHFSRFGVAPERVIWIPNGVDLRRFDEAAGAAGRREDGTFRILYLGSHGPADDLPVLLEAAAILQRDGVEAVRFVLVGDGPMKAELQDEARRRGLRNVEFRDPVRKTEVPAVLAEVDATTFILPDWSLYKYGISLNKTFDYLAARKPFLLVGHPRNNVVQEAGCGLNVPPRDPRALADAAAALCRATPEERRAMGERGREYVERVHDIRILAQRLRECLEDVVAGRPAVGSLNQPGTVPPSLGGVS